MPRISPRGARRLRKIGFFLVGACLLLLLLQPLLRWAANYYLTNEARLPVRIGRLFINPATSRVSVGLQGSKPGQILVLDLGAVRFDWWTILLKRLRVGQVRLENARFSVKREADGRLFISDIELPAGEPETPARSKTEKPSGRGWGVGLGRVDISTVTIDYQDPAMAVRLDVRRFTLDPVESWHPNTDSHFSADLLLQGAPLRISGTVRPFANPLHVDGHLELSSLPLDWLHGAVAASGISQLQGRLSAGIDFDAQVNAQTQETEFKSSGHVDASSMSVRGTALPLSQVGFHGRVGWDRLEVAAGSATIRRVQFEKISLGPAARVEARDDVQKPVFHYALAPVNVSVGPGRLYDAERRIPFDVDLRATSGGTIRLRGSVTPLATVPDGALTLDIDKLSLPAFSPLLEKKTSYRIANGQFTLSTNAESKRGALDSLTKLDAYTFYVRKLRAEEREETMESIGLPLGLGLALLRDAEDHIRLEVPVTGELTDPKVPVGKLVWTFIQKALASAVRNAAMAFFPGGGAQGFQPVVFAPGSQALEPGAQAYLVQLGQSMAKRPQVVIRLTGTAAPADYYALARKKTPEGNAALSWDTVAPATRAKLKALAGARAQAVQAFLTQQAGVSPERMPLKPSAEDPAGVAKPRVDFGF